MRRAFTLVELFVVMVILGALCISVVWMANWSLRQARQAKLRDAIRAVEIKSMRGSTILKSTVVDGVTTQGTTQELISAVSSWVVAHPGYEIKTIVPAGYTAHTDNMPNSGFVIVAVRSK